jgi:hypothetical protein
MMVLNLQTEVQLPIETEVASPTIETEFFDTL